MRDLIDHLATLTRDTITIGGQPVGKLANPTPDQHRAFDLIGAHDRAAALVPPPAHPLGDP